MSIILSRNGNISGAMGDDGINVKCKIFTAIAVTDQIERILEQSIFVVISAMT
jgi:hypothetical protein